MRNSNIKNEETEQALILFEAALQGDDQRLALGALRTLCKRKHVSVAINLYNKRARLPLLLKHEDPKIRKNTARLLGELGLAVDISPLKEALLAEETYFVVPSIILALGALSEERAIIEYKAALSEKKRHRPQTARRYKNRYRHGVAARRGPVFSRPQRAYYF